MKILFDEKASFQLKEYANKAANKMIRLKVTGKGWGKPALGIVLDEQREDDILEIVQGISFLVKKDELIYLNDVEILYSPYYINDGFYVRSAK